MPGPTFLIPSTLSDLESSPLSLLPYPSSFDPDCSDRDSAFESLLLSVQSPLPPDPSSDSVYGREEGDKRTALQAEYTLVRKNLSLPNTLQSLLAKTLSKTATKLTDLIVQSTTLVSEEVRSAFGARLYLVQALLAAQAAESRMQARTVGELNEM